MVPVRRWLPMVIAVGLVGGSALVALQRRLDATLQPLRQEAAVLYLPSGTWLKRLSLGYDGLLACIYWTRAVQHYGRERLATSQSFPLLYALLDITTTLDPELVIAYRFGALFLAEPPPLGPGRVEEAVKLLEKGMAAKPRYWRFWGDLGFIYYWNTRDYARASTAFLEGSRKADAPAWMKVMAARVASEGRDRKTSLFLWHEIYQSTDDPAIRGHALLRWREVKVGEDVEQLEALVARYRRERRAAPRSVNDLVEGGYLAGMPVDPLGFPYWLDQTGRVRPDPRSPLAPVAAREKR